MPPNFKLSNLQFLSLLLIASVFVLTGCGKADKTSSNSFNRENSQIAGETAVFQCIDSQSICDIKNEYGEFLVQFDKSIILTELPFNVSVSHQGKAVVNKVTAYMEGKEMFMGKVPIFFSSDADNVNKKFIAESMLASCAEEVMTWVIHIEAEGITEDGEKFSTIFMLEFDSKRSD